MAKKIKTIKRAKIWADNQWTVRYGILNPGPGRPQAVERLFRVVGEKLPFEAISHVNTYLKDKKIGRNGVYIAHDSMGYARYVGRGRIFQRLRARQKAQALELKYFSFYVVKDKKHEREIETLLIRAAGPLLQFNTRKKRVTISAGSLLDYEAGTLFFERRYKKGGRRSDTLIRLSAPRFIPYRATALFKGATAGLAFSSPKLGGQRHFHSLWWQALRRIFAEEHANVFVYEPGCVIGSD